MFRLILTIQLFWDMPVIAIDLGGTKIAAALFNDEGEIISSDRRQLENRKGKEVALLVIEMANELLRKSQQRDLHVFALGICVPGIAYSKTGKVWLPNIPGWEDYPLRKELKNGLSDKELTIKIESDRSCYILGEVWKGNAVGCSDAIFLSVGTGIGAGILAGGHVLHGSNDIAGSIGWMALQKPFQEKYIACGCFEYSASGEGIVRVAKEWMENHNESILQNKVSSLTAKDVFDAYDSNDLLARKVVTIAIEYWGMAVANLVSIFNPEKIIFGGGVFGPALKFLDAIYEEAKKWAQPISILQVTLEGSALGSEAGLYGAGYLALNDHII
ncbi:MAG: ROK family protein [Ginsengibacter sp.]